MKRRTPIDGPRRMATTNISSARLKLVLFDVDGTLISSGGAGARSWRFAFDRLHGIPADIGSHSDAGETDTVVARKTFEGTLGREPTHEELDAILALYLRRLSDEVATSADYRILDGATDLLVRLSDAGATLGIVSGAMEGAARVKLGRADLNRFFLFGGYGSDSPDRFRLTKMAIDRASALHGSPFDLTSVLVVGDTPLDVNAARSAGAVAVGVASGRYSIDDLRAAGADHVLATLADDFPMLDT
ncbi:MAG TPA: HAD family hydrolase [Candidatus Limnocylindrales bacterium]|nr:HAD family hydrolase [Candidatus Limnocylindrales bacterium]